MKIVGNIFIFSAMVFFCCELFPMGGNWFKTFYARYSSTIKGARSVKSQQLKKVIDEEDGKTKSTENQAKPKSFFLPQKPSSTLSFREWTSRWWQSLFAPKKD